MRLKILLFSTLFLLSQNSFAQKPKKLNAAEIHQAIKKLNFLGSVMYVAAHPDDENTRLISYLSNHLNANTTYLSLTRGDGGQNLIGSELRELLGVIRTQELLMARSVDGGKQWFTRANDFGYSKSPDESFEIWNKDKLMADVVWAIRKFQPDVIINRFDHRTPGRTHGHHTASAMISLEAHELTGDRKVFPDQLKLVDPWQAKRVFFNTSWWFYGSREKFEEADKSNLISVDAGVYYPLIGKSNTEIAAESRSMHRCQGFGSSGTRGSYSEYLEILRGDMPKNNDIFEGIDTSWGRLKGGDKIGAILKEVDENYDHQNPHASIKQLMEAYTLIKQLEDGKWKTLKLEEIETVILACMGLHIDALSNSPTLVRNGKLDARIELINRSPVKVVLSNMTIDPALIDSTMDLELAFNENERFNLELMLNDKVEITNAYWLNDSGSLGSYEVGDQELIGQPETPKQIKLNLGLKIEGYDFEVERDLVYKRTDPVLGEIYSPLEIVDPVSINIENPVYIFPDENPKYISVLVKAKKEMASGKCYLKLAEGWRSEPEFHDFSMEQKNEELRFNFKVFPPDAQSSDQITGVVEMDGFEYDRSMYEINYEHIPTQLIYQESQAKVVRLDIIKRGRNIAYLMGAGDAIPESLEQIGYKVDVLDTQDFREEELRKYDAVILGIRAFNTVDKLSFLNKVLFKYVENGGTAIVQYNTSRRLKAKDLGPYPLQLSRDRVTVEEAEVRILEPEHEVMNYPNKITEKDFDNWVQERGLYFPNEWDESYTAILSSNDPGESEKNGGLLVAEYGDGHFVYTGYSWFRQLPAGVPGAFRIFTNLISLGNNIQP